jgi:hypothetical protein
MNSKDSIYKKQKQMMKRLSKASLTNIIKGNDFKNVVIGGSKKYTDNEEIVKNNIKQKTIVPELPVLSQV